MTHCIKIYKKQKLPKIIKEFTDYSETQPKNCKNPFRQSKIKVDLTICSRESIVLR